MANWTDIEAGIAYLNERTKEFEQDVINAAEAEAEYRKQKAFAMADERAKGTPATVLRDIIFMRPEVQRVFLERARTAAIADADKEAINSMKLQLKLIDAQIARDWQASGERGY